MISDYWSKFRKTALNELGQNIIHFKGSSNKDIVPCIGDLVLVKDDAHIP